jgi:hypothetical protein
MTAAAALPDGLFDAAWYRRHNRDVAAAGQDPWAHYRTQGCAEGRDPNPYFDGAWYRGCYLDVDGSGMTPLEHYLQVGAAALRRPHPRFDAVWYVRQHPEAADNPLLYHLRVGRGRGWRTEPAPPPDPAPGTWDLPADRVGIAILSQPSRTADPQAVARVRDLIGTPGCVLLVADDGSAGDSVAALRAAGVAVVTGAPMGAAWNRNRALYLLGQVLGCDVVIVLREDAEPAEPGWEAAWVAGARRWGCIGHAADAGPDVPLSDACFAYSRLALQWGGYLDPADPPEQAALIHACRLALAGYGRLDAPAADPPLLPVVGQPGGIAAPAAPAPDVATILVRSRFDDGYRGAWPDDHRMVQFRQEIAAALAAAPAGFPAVRS